MKKIYMLFGLLGIFSMNSFAQNDVLHCGADEMTFQLVQEHPELLPTFEANRQALNEFTRSFQTVQAKSDTYIIPVVFHIIHANGTENIANEQIYDAIKILNEHFNKRNADTSDIIPAFAGIAANVGVEFRLAQKDPEGNCTNGITRTYSKFSLTGDHQVKSLIHWPSHQYLNIYVCRDAAGLAGHALMPEVADTLPELDGIVIRSDYVGTIGTSQWLHRVTLTHEVGHYLNLYHIWGGNNVPGFYYLPVADPGNCAYDDEVDDTPLTIGWQTCNINGSSCGSLDNVQNFMEYSYCSYMFTEGQKQRIIAALNSPMAGRNNLWSESNLIATGLLEESELCQVDFEPARPYVCLGDTLDILDRSFNNIQSRVWTITNGTVVAQQDSLVRVIFQSEGKQSVTLTVSDGTNEMTITKENIISVLPSTVEKNYINERFEYPDNEVRAVILNDENHWNFSTYAASGAHGYIANGFEEANDYTFITNPINLSQVGQAAMVFDRALRTIEGSTVEQLGISVSNDCGVTWKTLRTFLTNSSFRTNTEPLAEGPYLPEENEWESIAPFNIQNNYAKEHTMFKFTFNSKEGNNLYLDNLFIGEKSELSVYSLDDNKAITLYPNPASDGITISIEGNQHFPIAAELRDANGKIIHQETWMQNEQYISVRNLAKGVYFLNLELQEGSVVKKMVVK